MNLTIVDDTQQPEVQVELAKGGTELMSARLFESMPNDLMDKFQIVVSRPQKLDKDKIKILWCHDLAEDPAVSRLSEPGYRDQFELFVFVSNWQQDRFIRTLNIPPGKTVVIENGIVPIETVEKSKEKVKIVYTPTPHRGLELLVPVFESISKNVDNIELDVFSSFELYGWKHRDQQFTELFERCRNHPKINYHGTVSNEKVREALAESHIFAYPSIWPETSCLCLIEAMSARCISVHPNLAALPETSGGLTMMYQWHEDPTTHANRFGANLMAAINMVNTDQINPILDFVKTYADYKYSWERRKHVWQTLLTSILNNKVGGSK